MRPDRLPVLASNVRYARRLARKRDYNGGRMRGWRWV